MVSIKAAKLTILSVVVSSIILLGTMQTASADVNKTNDTKVSRQAIPGYEAIPLVEMGTSLKFKRTPSQVQSDVMSGKVAPTVKLSTTPISFEKFIQLYINTTRAKRGSAFIGVVVDITDPDWKEGAIQDVHRLAQYMIAGDTQKNKPGLALTDGASITGIIPIAYDPTDRVKKFVDASDMANEDVYYAILDAAILGRFSYNMREHADAYSVHVDRAVKEQEKHAAINAWVL